MRFWPSRNNSQPPTPRPASIRTTMRIQALDFLLSAPSAPRPARSMRSDASWSASWSASAPARIVVVEPCSVRGFPSGEGDAVARAHVLEEGLAIFVEVFPRFLRARLVLLETTRGADDL